MKARSKCKQMQSQALFFVSFRAFFIIQISNGTKNKTPEWVCSSDGRVFPSQGKGHGIDARHIHFLFSKLIIFLLKNISYPIL